MLVYQRVAESSQHKILRVTSRFRNSMFFILVKASESSMKTMRHLILKASNTKLLLEISATISYVFFVFRISMCPWKKQDTLDLLFPQPGWRFKTASLKVLWTGIPELKKYFRILWWWRFAFWGGGEWGRSQLILSKHCKCDTIYDRYDLWLKLSLLANAVWPNYKRTGYIRVITPSLWSYSFRPGTSWRAKAPIYTVCTSVSGRTPMRSCDRCRFFRCAQKGVVYFLDPGILLRHTGGNGGNSKILGIIHPEPFCLSFW